jgi:hypothetical protein
VPEKPLSLATLNRFQKVRFYGLDFGFINPLRAGLARAHEAPNGNDFELKGEFA